MVKQITIRFRCTTEEAQHYERAANACGISISRMIRAMLNERLMPATGAVTIEKAGDIVRAGDIVKSIQKSAKGNKIKPRKVINVKAKDTPAGLIPSKERPIVNRLKGVWKPE